MKKSTTVLAISILVLSLASQFSWCAEAAEGSAGISTEPDLQVQEQVHGDMKNRLEMQGRNRKLGHEVTTVELKHHRRITSGHKGGSAGGGAGAGAAGAGTGGHNVGGGGAVTRPHSSKNGAAALPVPVSSVLTLALACGVVLSVMSY
nr:retrotransposon protein SINE subclass [Zea mays]|eukprot:NP_001149590.1 retrotransposon protein SINE subclass precursor [Zea mays]